MQGSQLLLPIAVALLFWLLIIRPQSRRARELRTLQSSLEVGDAVVLTSGIHGTVVGTEEETLQVQIAVGVEITVARGAVGMARPPLGSAEPTLQDPEDRAADPAIDPDPSTNPDGTR